MKIKEVKVTTTIKFQVVETEHYEIGVNDTDGYFEHLIIGEESGGHLWIDEKMLVDYDGVYTLPLEVKRALRENFKIFVEDD